jgi:hypothetical protein
MRWIQEAFIPNENVCYACRAQESDIKVVTYSSAIYAHLLKRKRKNRPKRTQPHLEDRSSLAKEGARPCRECALVLSTCSEVLEC